MQFITVNIKGQMHIFTANNEDQIQLFTVNMGVISISVFVAVIKKYLIAKIEGKTTGKRQLLEIT